MVHVFTTTTRTPKDLWDENRPLIVFGVGLELIAIWAALAVSFDGRISTLGEQVDFALQWLISAEFRNTSPTTFQPFVLHALGTGSLILTVGILCWAYSIGVAASPSARCGYKPRIFFVWRLTAMATMLTAIGWALSSIDSARCTEPQRFFCIWVPLFVLIPATAFVWGLAIVHTWDSAQGMTVADLRGLTVFEWFSVRHVAAGDVTAGALVDRGVVVTMASTGGPPVWSNDDLLLHTANARKHCVLVLRSTDGLTESLRIGVRSLPTVYSFLDQLRTRPPADPMDSAICALLRRRARPRQEWLRSIELLLQQQDGPYRQLVLDPDRLKGILLSDRGEETRAAAAYALGRLDPEWLSQHKVFGGSRLSREQTWSH